MDIFDTLLEAKHEGRFLAKQRLNPTIYKRGVDEYILVSCREMPPEDAWPFLKWVGISPDTRLDGDSEWIPILAPLDSFIRAQEACGLFYLLGYSPLIVKYQTRGTYDIFLREDHVPAEGLIVDSHSEDGTMLETQPPRYHDEETDDSSVHIQFG